MGLGVPSPSPGRASCLALLCALLLSTLSAVASSSPSSSPPSWASRRSSSPPQCRNPSVCSTQQWCWMLPDGLHADHLATPPCSGFFQCQGRHLASLHACPRGLFFSESRGQCVPGPMSSCARGLRDGQGNQGATAEAEAALRPMGGPSTLRGGTGVNKSHILEQQFGGLRMDYGGWRAARSVREVQGRQLADPGWKEVNALLAFRNAVVDPRDALASWDFSRVSLSRLGRGAVCRGWYGVTCGASGRISKLELANIDPESGGSANKSLWGNTTVGQSIPPQIGDLVELQVLDLRANYDTQYFVGGLIGPLPSEIGQCTGLTSITLQYNKLSGSLPDSLSRLVSLQYLSLANNMFTGQLPAGLGALLSLTYLKAINNGFEGGLPPELGNLASLAYLALDVNPGIRGNIPASFTKLQRMTTLSMRQTGLEGPVPTFWASFPSLCYVGLAQNNLTGTLPMSLAQLGSSSTCNSVSVDLSFNQLSGDFPAGLADIWCNQRKLGPLVGINVAGNGLTGDLPLALFNCTALQSLKLEGNQLTGRLPPTDMELNLPVFSVLTLSDNKLTGAIPKTFLSLPYLSIFNVSGNQLTDMPQLKCNDSVGATQRITSVDLSRNLLQGDVTGPGGLLGPSFLTCTYMQLLDISHNQLSGTLPASLVTLPGGDQNQVVLKLHHNNFSGPVPAPGAGADCPALQILDASFNQFSGFIPDTLSKCTALSWLDLSNNRLSRGGIPFSLARLGGLQRLALAGNQLKHSLPSPLFSGLLQLSVLDLSHNQLEGPLPSNITRLAQLYTINLEDNQLTGTLPSSLTALSFLSSLSLSDNLLSGAIPDVLVPANMPNLFQLDLSNNDFTGNIPFGFANLTQAKGLVLNLSDNLLQGRVPGDLAQMAEAVEGNAELCGGGNYPPCPEPPSSSSSLSGGAIAGITVGAVIAALSMVAVTWWYLRPRDEWAGGTMLVFDRLDYPFTGKDLLDITDNFGEKHLLGAGGFGAVYKATMPDGREVAIKRLKEDSTQGNKEFEAEITSLGNIRHRNLVTLVAAYVAAPPSKERVLIYDMMAGGSLDHILAREMPPDSPYRKWEVRKNIALDVARGLSYLHHDCQPRIIHRDMKPANVLMDVALNGHVADFGLARQADASKSHMSTAVYGTVGYLAIEYVRDGRLSFKSDVFAYGVTLLEIITGRRPTDKEVSERGLSRWVGMQETDQVVDPRMEVQPGEMEELKGAIKLGLLCTSKVPVDRPNMAEVYHLLGHLEDFAADQS